jgi:hypothetical protein
MRIEIEEENVVGVLLRNYHEFEQFYKEERLKKVGVIQWFRDYTLDESLEAVADTGYSNIYFRRFPESRADAHVIAHEI